MQRREIDYFLYSFWLGLVLAQCCFVFGLIVIDRNSEWFGALLGAAVVYAVLITTSWFINVALIPIILRIRLAIDKKRNPEKYKAIEELDKEIDKMTKELDEEIEKIIKEKNDGQ